MAKYHVRAIMNTLLLNKNKAYAETHRTMIEFVKYYLMELGVDLDTNTCPFCGRRVADVKKHLLNASNSCGKTLRKYIDEAQMIYHELRLNANIKRRRGRMTCYCSICGYSAQTPLELILHIYEEHYNKKPIPVHK